MFNIVPSVVPPEHQFSLLSLLYLPRACVCVCVYMCVYIFIKLHITAQSGPVILAILCRSH